MWATIFRSLTAFIGQSSLNILLNIFFCVSQIKVSSIKMYSIIKYRIFLVNINNNNIQFLIFRSTNKILLNAALIYHKFLLQKLSTIWYLMLINILTQTKKVFCTCASSFCPLRAQVAIVPAGISGISCQWYHCLCCLRQCEVTSRKFEEAHGLLLNTHTHTHFLSWCYSNTFNSSQQYPPRHGETCSDTWVSVCNQGLNMQEYLNTSYQPHHLLLEVRWHIQPFYSLMISGSTPFGRVIVDKGWHQKRGDRLSKAFLGD